MERQELLKRISGTPEQDLLESYPQLSHEDIMAALAFAAEMTRERYVELAV